MKKKICFLALCLTLLCLCACGGEVAETTPTTEATEHVHVYEETVTEASCTVSGVKERRCCRR